jgi:hypothetical protein
VDSHLTLSFAYFGHVIVGVTYTEVATYAAFPSFCRTHRSTSHRPLNSREVSLGLLIKRQGLNRSNRIRDAVQQCCHLLKSIRISSFSMVISLNLQWNILSKSFFRQFFNHIGSHIASFFLSQVLGWFMPRNVSFTKSSLKVFLTFSLLLLFEPHLRHFNISVKKKIPF